MNATAKKILDVSLELFSKRGFDAVTVEDIAKVVGIKAPSLYNHFPSKKAIFVSLVESVFDEYEKGSNDISLHTLAYEKDSHIFIGISDDNLVSKVKQMFLYSIHNEKVSQMRKLLTIEQFRNAELAELYTTRYIDRLVEYHKGVFKVLIEAKIINNYDVDFLAYSYVCPINTLIGICDRQPDKEEECLQKLDKFVRTFFNTVNVK